MTELEIIDLLNRYEAGVCTPRESKIVESWYIQKASSSEDELYSDDLWIRKEASRDFIFSHLDSKQVEARKKVVKLWARISISVGAAAAIILCIWLGSTFLNTESASRSMINAHAIGPGKHTAILTLANGKKLQLSDAKTGVVMGNEGLNYSDGSEIAPDAGQLNHKKQLEMLTVSTPRGGTYEVTLPDGSRVWLNTDSKISFPSRFEAKARKVFLEGEAYFEVKKMPGGDQTSKIKPGAGTHVKKGGLPFLVESEGQEVEVLGTKFNIMAYHDEEVTKVSLLEGAVAIASGKDGRILKPGEQALINNGNVRIQQVADIESTVAWKNGDFTFKGEDFKTTMRKIARWYNVEISYDPSLPDNIELAGWISRNSRLSTVLKRIEQAGKIHFKVEGRRITVMK